MATLLQVTNRVLKRLRESEVTGTQDNAYSALICDFVVDVYKQVADIRDWTFLNHNIIFDLVASSSPYDISNFTGSGGALDSSLNPRAATTKSWVLYSQGCPQIYLFDNSTDKKGQPVSLISSEEYWRRFRLDSETTNTDPVALSLEQNFDGKMYAYVDPVSSGTKRIKMRVHTPVTEISSDGSDDATELLIDDRVVFLGALFYALNERGEEIGESGAIAETRFNDAVADLIETDIKQQESTDEYDWRRD